MKELEALRGIDVYLIDQLLKGRIQPNGKILDAGCGGGRNIHYLIRNGFEIMITSTRCSLHSRRHWPKMVFYSFE